MSIEAMKLALDAHKKNESHRTIAETRYWCEQYKLLAEQLIQSIEQAEHDPIGDAQDRLIAEQAEQRVAWMWEVVINDVESCHVTQCEPPEYATKRTPLYTAPPQSNQYVATIDISPERVDKTQKQRQDVSQRKPLTEWQPIETAPKTGIKVILFYLNRNNLARTVMARWLTDEQAAETDADDVGLEGGWYECIDNWNDYTEVAIHEGEPSHWMPLPPPPIEAAHGIKE
jgi:hypothetical protein